MEPTENWRRITNNQNCHFSLFQIFSASYVYSW